MKYLLGLLATVALTWGALQEPAHNYSKERSALTSAYAAEAPEWTMRQRVDFIDTVLYLDVVGLDLDVVTPPKLEIGWYPNWWRANSIAGWYDGGDTIWLSQWVVDEYGLDSLLAQEVITHELTHWVDANFRGDAYEWRGERWQWSEENAWHVGNTYYVYMGRPELADYEWYERYGFSEARPVTPWDPRGYSE